MTRPKTGVLLCALPRVGSTLLCDLLHSTGAVGYPGEWFLYPERARLWREWGVGTHDEYLERVLEEGTAPNGVFGAKLMWGHLGEFLVYARLASGDYSSTDREAIAALLPSPRFVWLRRHDEVAQAVSWSKAVQTGQWRAGGENREASYSFAQVDWLLHQLRVWDGAWERWFDAQGIEPHVVWYEELEENPQDAVDRVLAHAGLEGITTLTPSTHLRKQADGVNAHWVARYLTER